MRTHLVSDAKYGSISLAACLAGFKMSVVFTHLHRRKWLECKSMRLFTFYRMTSFSCWNRYSKNNGRSIDILTLLIRQYFPVELHWLQPTVKIKQALWNFYKTNVMWCLKTRCLEEFYKASQLTIGLGIHTQHFLGLTEGDTSRSKTVVIPAALKDKNEMK